MTKSTLTGTKCLAFLLLIFSVQAGVQAQNYFAGTSAGLGNTSSYSTAVGTGALSVNNAGSATAAFGYQSLKFNSTGVHNTAVGTYSLKYNTVGSDNTGIGYYALQGNASGNNNTAVGNYSLYSNSTGFDNSAVGFRSLYFNTTGHYNLAVGNNSLYKNLTGSGNISFGYNTMYNNTSGSYNIAMGGSATLNNNTGGSYNIALGLGSMGANTTAGYNIALGTYALGTNTTGYNNIAIGQNAMYKNVIGYSNTAIGNNALYSNTGKDNIGIGEYAGKSFNLMDRCTFVGNYSDATVTGLSNATAIGYLAKVSASNSIVAGNSSVTSIGGQVGWTTLSDVRLKTNINKSKLGLDFILSLNPVSYNYKAEGQKNIEYTGLLAQEVDAAASKAGIVFSGVDKTGEYWGIRYAELTVPLIKALQEMNEKNEAAIAELKQQIADLKVAQRFNQSSASSVSTAKNQSILFQNQPNPFNQSTVIRYELKAGVEKASVVIRDLNGAMLKHIDINQPGKGTLTINANEMTAGTYTYTLVVNGESVETKLMVLVK